MFLVTGDVSGIGTIGWNPAPVRVNDDSAADNFSEGNRPQFMPTVAVDQVTGTVGVMYYDGRWDPSLTRMATSFSASIDGGRTFSETVHLNQLKTALDALDTTRTITIEPIPGNQRQSPFAAGFGERQGLVMNAGRVVPAFASNLNAAARSDIMTARVTVAAGPRVVQGDFGPVQQFTVTSGPGALTYNTTATPDGRRRFEAFQVVLDRPIDASSFTPADIDRYGQHHDHAGQ